mmetsp:Transcript_63080/g.174835  ORF Transcript_63080/g.174835 Transcript_63080/m.174835 type:complete len:193 (-) Transcript_63080:320-898(-)|eukprot:CAMPEP_0179058274 /NCGR_PEP_ID=MMETSP0796-20121207/24766_1 /TAXON_ID=73915 /ORGANISM="Pyrodinium bahamense, Strain pbaha01" /LENGTH=192 /DNA_ID=CAMNT_0020755021 /DNA_START=64 /DNA_END=642 /DNA_ORIENTATION=+
MAPLSALVPPLLLALLALPATADYSELPPDLQELLGETPLFGMESIEAAWTAWAQGEQALELADKREACEKVSAALFKAADAPHDLFNGMRIFANSLKKAAEKADDETALDKALGLRPRFIKAMTGKLVEKMKKQHLLEAKMMKDAQEAQAKKAAEATTGTGEADEEDDDDYDIEADDKDPDLDDKDDKDEF